MNDFRLLVFIAVAKNLSFTKAANELRVSQPAVSKHISELEALYGVQLFERVKNGVSLTKQGAIFLVLAQEICQKYKDLEFEMNILSNNYSGNLIIGASTTIAQYILPKIIAKFMKRFPEIKLSLISGNTSQIEQYILDNKVDIGFVEGASHKKEFHYSALGRDELVLVTTTKNRSEEIGLDQLKTLPLVLRENGSGTLEVIINVLKEKGVNFSTLNVLIQLGSSEAIKRYIIESNSFAILSVNAVFDELKSGKLQIIDIDCVMFEREFSYIVKAGSQNRLADEFSAFVSFDWEIPKTSL
ncbi:MAG: LysR substrate-binding domain-containing protein [Rikenellaceae bacterium]